MAKSSKNAMVGSGENINHFGAVRIRVVGTGNLQLSLNSLDETVTQSLEDIVLTSTTNIQPLRLSNFKQQRAQLVLTTTEIDETFKVNRIVVFVKSTYTDFPSALNGL